MEAVRNDTSLSHDEMQKQLQALQTARETLIKEAQERAIENEKRKALLPQSVLQAERLAQSQWRSVRSGRN